MSNSTSLRNQYDEMLSPAQPLAVDTVEAQLVTSKSETLTYNGKAAAGAVTINSTSMKAIVSEAGDQVASYWGLDQNRVYTAKADNDPSKGSNWVTSLTETATAAEVVVYDPDKNLENMFESATGTVKRFVLKATDTSGAVLYGWIFGVAASSDVYTIDIVNNRLTETQSWVGTLGSFDNTAIKSVEIFRYSSSLAFGTGTTLTEEVICPREYSKKWENPIVFAEALDNGQYFVDYMRGRVIGKKADATASETITYNIWQSLSGGGGGIASDVNLDEVAGTATNVNGGNRDAGTQTVTLADDDPAVVDLAAIELLNTDIKTAVELLAEAYSSLVQGIMTAEVNPLNMQFVPITLIDETNIPQTSDETVSFSLDGHRYFSLQGETSGATPTDVLTVTVEASNDGVTFQDITNDAFGVASWVDTDFFALSDTPLAFKDVRVRYTTSTGGGNDADLTVYVKKMY